MHVALSSCASGFFSVQVYKLNFIYLSPFGGCQSSILVQHSSVLPRSHYITPPANLNSWAVSGYFSSPMLSLHFTIMAAPPVIKNSCRWQVHYFERGCQFRRFSDQIPWD